MIMSALKAGGMDLVTDGAREGDGNNPKVYCEYEPGKNLPKSVTDWVESAPGKGVKIISPLLEYLPEDYQY